MPFEWPLPLAGAILTGLLALAKLAGVACLMSVSEPIWTTVVGAFFRSAHRSHEGILRAHDDDGQIRTHFLDARQKIERENAFRSLVVVVNGEGDALA